MISYLQIILILCSVVTFPKGYIALSGVKIGIRVPSALRGLQNIVHSLGTKPAISGIAPRSNIPTHESYLKSSREGNFSYDQGLLPKLPSFASEILKSSIVNPYSYFGNAIANEEANLDKNRPPISNYLPMNVYSDPERIISKVFL